MQAASCSSPSGIALVCIGPATSGPQVGWPIGASPGPQEAVYVEHRAEQRPNSDEALKLPLDGDDLPGKI